MKVCVVVCNSVWYDPRVRKQLVEYNNSGVDLSCVGFECNRYDEEKLKTIPCKHTIVMQDKNFLGKQKNVLRKLKRDKIRKTNISNAIISYKPDVIHANDLDALIPSYYAARKLKCKLIYDSHEICTENIGLIKRPLYARYLKTIERRLVKKIDKMVCVSNAAADYFAKKYKIERPLVVTNCTLKSEKCEPLEKNEGFEVLNHGQFYAGRGYDVMVEASTHLKDFPEIKLALRGFGVMEQSLKDRARELDATNVIFYPKVLVQELIPMATKSRVGVAMTENICLNFALSVSNKLFEYAAAGLPVIMSNIPEHRYLNDKYKFGIVLIDDKPETFAAAVLKLYTDKEFYNTCAKNAVILADEINWENDFAKLLEIETNLLK